ncbi:YheC/YheD family endospore coat-associated protein [Syntrophomonas palmitatica]|uniref:YheC/YheD family endospore coat-associated protein n=1 Tax=Syntrophomonas palmitatica TaxID=402877 RepID=UPI0006D1AFC8|nr:YheC/YheD family protein [Syntrophomonas palmitatica]
MYDFPMVNIRSNVNIDADYVYFSYDLAEILDIEKMESIKIFVGKHHRKMKARVSDNARNQFVITMNPAAITRLFLHSGRNYGMQNDCEGLRLGPVVGIMVDHRKNAERPFGNQTGFMAQLLASARKFGEIAYVFSPSGINWHNLNITGFSHSKNGWIKGIFPIPNVVYVRGQFHSPVRTTVRKKLESQGVQFINAGMGGKWQTHRILERNAEFSQYLPETRLVNSFRQIENMLSRYRAIYLKPVNGAQGKNIIKVSRKGNGAGYEYLQSNKNNHVKHQVSTIGALQSSLRPLMGNRLYIVQNQIDLIRSDGNIIDVRVMVQKDHSGAWGTTGMACRVGRTGSITSNISGGGYGREVLEMLAVCFNDYEKAALIQRNISEVSLMAARLLEAALGRCGEMGIDIGVDKYGKAWFIEANPRPARHVFSLIGDKETRQLSIDKPMLYSRYLAGFSNSGQ